MAPTRRRRTGGQADANTYLPFIPLLRLPTRPFGWSPHPQRAWNHSEVSVVVCAKSTVSTLFTLLLSGTYFGLITWRSNNMAKRRIGPRTNISRRVGGEVSSANEAVHAKTQRRAAGACDRCRVHAPTMVRRATRQRLAHGPRDVGRVVGWPGHRTGRHPAHMVDEPEAGVQCYALGRKAAPGRLGAWAPGLHTGGRTLAIERPGSRRWCTGSSHTQALEALWRVGGQARA